MAGWRLTAQMVAQGDAYAAHVAPTFFHVWSTEAAHRLGLKRGERVLDVACGAGGASRAAADAVGASGRVVGLDASWPMLRAARRDGAARPVTWMQADAQSLPFADGAFDAISCAHGLMFFEDATAALAEMTRVLRPGGRLVATTWSARDRNPHEQAMAAAFHEELGEEPAFFSDLFAFDGPATLERLARDVGFPARVARVPRVARFPSATSYWEGLARGRPVAELLDALPPVAAARIRRRTLARLAPYADAGGYTFPMEGLVLLVERP